MKRLLLVSLLLAAPAAWACIGLKVSGAWIREAPPGAPMMAGYARIANPGKGAQTICHLDSPDFGEVMMHETHEMNGMSHMRDVSELEIPAGGKRSFEPGGLHLMLMQPKRALKTGDKATINFHCGPGKPLGVVFTVKTAP